MNALAAMIAKQKALQEGTGTQSAGGGAGVVESAKPAAAKLTFGIKGAATPKPTPLAKALETIMAPGFGESTSASSSSVEQVDSSTILSLDDLAASEDSGKAPPVSRATASFNDEIPSTAPERELPENLEDQQLAFVQQLDSIYEIVHDPELFGNMIRTIMQELQEVPDYMKLMADQDVHTMIRGLRSSMGLAKIKKAEKSTKARGSRKAPATTAMTNTLDEIFDASDW